MGVVDLPAGVFDLSEGVVDRPAGLHGRESAFGGFVIVTCVLNLSGEAERVDEGLAGSEGVLNRFELIGNRDCGDCFISGRGDLYLSRLSRCRALAELPFSTAKSLCERLCCCD